MDSPRILSDALDRLITEQPSQDSNSLGGHRGTCDTEQRPTGGERSRLIYNSPGDSMAPGFPATFSKEPFGTNEALA